MYSPLTRKQRFREKNNHYIISYVLHTISITLIIVLFINFPKETSQNKDAEWHSFDKNTQTLQLKIHKLIVGDQNLKSSQTKKTQPIVVVHGYLKSTGLDIEKKVVVHGTDIVEGAPGAPGAPGKEGAPGKDGETGENIWWNYTNNILFITPNMVVVQNLDVTNIGYVHEMLYTKNMDISEVNGEAGYPRLD